MWHVSPQMYEASLDMVDVPPQLRRDCKVDCCVLSVILAKLRDCGQGRKFGSVKV